VTVPVTSELAAFLQLTADDDPGKPVIEILRGRPVSSQGLADNWLKLKRKARVNEGLWIHDLRRTLAVSLYEISKDLRVVEQMLGHTSLASTIGYLEHRDAQKLKPYLESIHTVRTRFIQ